MPTSDAGKRVQSAVIGAVAGSVLFALLSTPTARADFFDDLFGFDQSVESPRAGHYSVTRRPRRGPLPAPPVAAYPPPYYRQEAPRKPRVAHFRRDVDFRQEGAGYETATGSRPVKPAFCSRTRKMPLFNQLLSDSTLRTGDIVVTAAGLRVFHGNGLCPHKPTDFLALHRVDLARGKLRMLAGLELTTQPRGERH
jgi:hypothetical protein